MRPRGRHWPAGLLGTVALAVWVQAQAPPASLPARPVVDVLHYTARVEPHLADKSLTGRVTIRLVVTAANIETIDLERSTLTIDEVQERGRPLPFATPDGHLTIRLPRPAADRETHEIDIEYHGTPGSGMQLLPERSQIYTVFSTTHWLPGISAPADKATLDLSVVLPPDMVAAGSGDFVGRRRLENGTVLHQWREAGPVPAYTFGFAAGHFEEAVEERGNHRFTYLGEGVAAADLRRLFRESSDMMAFFEERAGVPYPHAAYTQALVARTAGQEMSGLTILSEDYGRAVLADERAIALMAHELAHQWWGNGVTCVDFGHFWLNEGFATFMADAYVERRFGRDAYRAAIAASRERYEKVRDAGHDRSLVFPEWNRPTADDRTLVYHKGAYVLHLLREHVGEAAFWDGIRQYTRAFMGQSVTTADFVQSMERSSGRSLGSFFEPVMQQPPRPRP
jgi:aminopeptidase N